MGKDRRGKTLTDLDTKKPLGFATCVSRAVLSLKNGGGLDVAAKHPLCSRNIQPMTTALWALFLC